MNQTQALKENMGAPKENRLGNTHLLRKSDEAIVVRKFL
jgi:hypothetical protein